jgi:hypothetical protein
LSDFSVDTAENAGWDTGMIHRKPAKLHIQRFKEGEEGTCGERSPGARFSGAELRVTADRVAARQVRMQWDSSASPVMTPRRKTPNFAENASAVGL